MARPLTLCHFFSLSKPNSGVPPPPSSALPPQHRPITVVMGQQTRQSYWAAIESDIDAYLKKTVTVRLPTTVFEPMHHLVFAHPRTMAPALCLAACDLVGGDRTAAVVAAASALHLVHSAVLTHQNLQLASQTRPVQDTPHAYNPNIELLTGDGIAPFGLELLAGAADPARGESDRVVRAVVEITRAMGAQGFIKGRYKEIKGGAHACEEEEGELHACGAACGAILGGGSEEEIERLRVYGLYVGMMQVIMTRGDHDGERTDEIRRLALEQLDGLRGREIEPLASLVAAADLRVA